MWWYTLVLVGVMTRCASMIPMGQKQNDQGDSETVEQTWQHDKSLPEELLSPRTLRGIRENFLRFGRNNVFLSEAEQLGKRGPQSFLRFGRRDNVDYIPKSSDQQLGQEDEFVYDGPSIPGKRRQNSFLRFGRSTKTMEAPLRPAGENEDDKRQKRSIVGTDEELSEFWDGQYETEENDNPSSDKRGTNSFLRFGRREQEYPVFLYQARDRKNISPSSARKRLLQKSFLRFGRGDAWETPDLKRASHRNFLRFG